MLSHGCLNFRFLDYGEVEHFFMFISHLYFFGRFSCSLSLAVSPRGLPTSPLWFVHVLAEILDPLSIAYAANILFSPSLSLSCLQFSYLFILIEL